MIKSRLNPYEFISSVEHKIRYIKECWQLTVAIDFHCIFFFLLWKSMAIVNFLIANILWNIFVCVFNRRKKLIQVWNNLKMSKWQHSHFWVNYSCKDTCKTSPKWCGICDQNKFCINSAWLLHIFKITELTA